MEQVFDGKNIIIYYCTLHDVVFLYKKYRYNDILYFAWINCVWEGLELKVFYLFTSTALHYNMVYM